MPFRYPRMALAAALLVTGAHAKTFNDLERVKPVEKNEPIPMSDYIRPSLMGWPRISPDGTHIAALVKTPEDRGALIVYGLDDKKLESFGGVEDFSFHNFHWLNSETILASVGSKKAKRYGLYGLRLRPAKGTLVYRVAGASSMSIVGVPKKNRTMPIMVIRGGYIDSESTLGLAVRVDAANEVRGIEDETSAWDSGRFPYGVAANITEAFSKPAGGLAKDYLCDPQGELAYGYTASGKGWTMHRYNSGRWTPLPVNLDEVEVEAVSMDPDKLIVSDTRPSDKPRGLSLFDPKESKYLDTLFEDDKYDVVDPRFYRDATTGRILGVQYNRSGPTSVWFDAGYQRIQDLLNKSNPGKIVTIIDSDDQHRRVIISIASDRQPAVYYWVDLVTMRVDLIKSSAPWIDPERMRPTQVMAYKARDGKKIEAYLTLPAGASKEHPVPLIVYPHGGPWARDTWGFDGEVQLLVSHGYAVFQPNYRGSDGYLWQFPEADRFEFRKMHDDVTDGTKALIKSGLVDPKRIAIMGGSFGGYLSICGIAFERDLYSCAVTMAGVFDWELFVKTLGYEDDLGSRAGFLRRNLGDPKQEKEKYDAISPLRHLEGVTKPIFVTHGKDDRTVPISESKALLSILSKNDIPFEKYFMSDEAHGVWFFEHRMEYHKRILAFLDKHLGGGAIGQTP